jgi:hypothetical protein
MQFNNITANSTYDSNRLNAYSWQQRYNDYITLPKSISLLRASIPVTYLSFQKQKLSLYIYVYSNIYEIKLTNGYYDDVLEFLPMLNSATTSAVGNNEFTWTFSTANQCLKLSSSSTVSFTIKSYNYNSFNNLSERLGFIDDVDYNSYLENNISVIYAEGVLQLARTTGFYITSSLVPSNNCVTPSGAMGILDYIPIQTKNISYGDVITLTNSAQTANVVHLSRNEQFNANASFVFQILDDKQQLIDDNDRGGEVVLYIQLDYD